MPTSLLAAAPRIVNLVETADPHRTILDVGAGWGKYATLLREYLNDKPERIDAVEAWEPYVHDHRLIHLYDEVIVGDVMRLGEPTFRQYDVVLMVDVFEHLTTHDAGDLLGRIPGTIVICTPAVFFDNPPDLPWTEAHRSHWTVEDFARTGRLEFLDEGAISELGAIIVRLGPIL